MLTIAYHAYRVDKWLSCMYRYALLWQQTDFYGIMSSRISLYAPLCGLCVSLELGHLWLQMSDHSSSMGVEGMAIRLLLIVFDEITNLNLCYSIVCCTALLTIFSNVFIMKFYSMKYLLDSLRFSEGVNLYCSVFE